MRGRCLPRGADEHQMKRRLFAFAVDYSYCFRTYSVYLSLRLPAQILYAGIHLPPQREARALPPPCTEFAKVQAAVKPASGGLPSSVTVLRSAAPRRKARNLPKCAPQTFLSIIFCPHGAKKQLPLTRELRSAFDFVSCDEFFPSDAVKPFAFTAFQS